MGAQVSTARYWESSVEKVLVSKEQIIAKVKEFAKIISDEYAGEEIILVGVLKGGFIFLSDLSKEVNIPHEVDFIKVSSYSGTERSDIKKFTLDVTEDITDKHVIIVEDCIDSGKTLTFVKKTFEQRKCKSVKVMCLIDKAREREEGTIVPDWIGFKVPDVWIVGYGLDLGGKFRTLPCVAEVDPKKYQTDC